MDAHRLAWLLEGVRSGQVPVDDALAQLRDLPTQELGFAVLDHHRSLRTGMPEVVFCQGKAPEQVVQIVGQLLQRQGRALATRASAQVAQAVLAAHPDARYHELARVLTVQTAGEDARRDRPHYAAIATGGTCDIPVAEEAALTLEFLGHPVQRVYDVGVAGIHRLFNKRDLLSQATVVIAVAGMEGALASVIGGLVSCPVVAVPTSIGYGAHFGGLATLLAMLNSCAPGVVVVNIDNGFGAAVHAHQILRSIRP